MVLLFSAKPLQSQTFTLTHNINYATYHQNMWGPSWEPFDLNFDYELFSVQWDESWSWSQITDIFGEQFGVGIDVGTWGLIASHFSMYGFTTGFVNVKYPVEIHLTFPADQTFDHGETVTVNSDYTVLPGWELDTHYPTIGSTTLDMDFGMGAHIGLITCLGDCDTIYVFPPINIPVDSITIFHIDSSGYCVYPSYNPNIFPPFEFVETNVFPIIIDDWFNIGLTGWIAPPYVITTDTLMPDQCLYASGDSTYLHLNLNIITFISALAGLIPPPTGPAIQQALAYLNGSIDIPIGPSTATITWSIIQASFYMSSTQEQDFTFCPTIWCHLGFPTSLNYTVTDPSAGNTQVAQGNNDTIVFAVNNDAHITYPCQGFDTMPISIEYTLTNDFTNHTWDSIAFGFQFSALTFTFHLPTFYKALAEVDIPDFCLPVLDSTNDDAILAATAAGCMPGYTAPAVSTSDSQPKEIMDIDFQIGPLFQDSIPLGYIPFTWYNNTWNLEDFTPADTVVPPTQIVPTQEMTATISSAGVLCFGDSTGTIVAQGFNGHPPYTFTYSNGVVNTHISSIDSIHVSAGYYTVTVSDFWGCEIVGSVTVMDLHPPILIHLGMTPVLCNGDSTGSINSTVSGGVPGYTYIWNPSGQTIADPVNLWADTYTVTVTDAVGCTKIDSITVTEPPFPVAITDTFTNISCNAGSDGTIDITVTGGTPPYTYSWTNGLHTEDLNNLTAGTYSVTVTDNNGCQETHTVTLTEPTPLQIQVLATDVSCYHMADGAIDITVSGGTPPYTYLWNNSAVTEDVSGLTSGNYRVTVTDSLGCIKIAIALITEPLAPLTVSYTSVNVRCNGGNNGAIDLTVFGGTSPYSYNWTNGAISQDLTALTAGTYSVTVTDAHQCDTMLTITITEPPQPLSASAVGIDVLCYGGYTGSIDLTVSGGTPPYIYVWSNGFTTEDITDLTQGIYTVTVMDANLCIANVTLFIDQPDEISFLVSADEYLCFGQSATLSVVYSEGGVLPYDIIWSNGAHGDSIVVTPEEDADYTVQITDANGCQSYPLSIHVKVDPPLAMELTTNTDTVCPGDPVALSANISGGGIVYPYTIYINDTITGNPPITVFPDAETLYTAWVFDRCKFDSIVDTMRIYTYPIPPLNFSFDKASGCQPLTVHFIESSLNVGQTYLWDFDDGDFENLSFDKNPIHIFHNAVVYHVRLRVTSINGCRNESDTAIITVFKKPDARFTYDPLIITLTNSTVKFFNYSSDFISQEWKFGDGALSAEPEPEHAYQNYGIYTAELYVTSNHGCVDTAMAKINVESELTFYAPTAFTPDGDGKNEYFKVFAHGYQPDNFTMMVYDRWGEIIFESNTIEKGWDGKVRGKLCPPGVYTWIAIFRDVYGNSVQKAGTVTLIK